MDSIAIPCADLNSAKKIWNELVSDQRIKDSVSSKKLISSLPGLISDLKKEELSGIFKTRHIHGNINFEQFLCLVAAWAIIQILKRLLLLTIYHRTTVRQ